LLGILFPFDTIPAANLIALSIKHMHVSPAEIFIPTGYNTYTVIKN
jgi:hypothetical protein